MVDGVKNSDTKSQNRHNLKVSKFSASKRLKMSTKYARYVDLAKAATNYGTRMNRLSARIFGEVVRPTNNKSMKVVKLFSQEPLHLRKDVTEYYPRHPETGMLMRKLRHYGLFRDEHEDFKDEMKRLRALRGKEKPVRVPRNKQEEK